VPPPDLPVAGPDPPVLPAAVLASAAAGHLEATLHAVVQAAVDHLGALYGVLGVLTADGRRLDRLIVVGADPAEVERIRRLPVGHRAVRLVVDEPRILQWEDFGRDPASLGFPPGHPARRPFLGVPVRVGGAVFGNLYLTERSGGGPLAPADVEVVMALAAVAGLAIGNARLAERAENGRTWLQAGTDVATALLSGADPDEVLRTVATRVVLLTGADLAGVLLPGPDEDDDLTVTAAAGQAAADLEGVRIPLAATHVGRVHRSGTAALVDDVGAGPVVGQRAALALEIAAGFGPVLMVPFGKRPAMGMIVALRTRGRAPFDAAQLDPLESFATQTALAVELARSQQRERRLQVQADRDRIARDLHDHVVQRIFATALSLDRLSRSLEHHQPEAARRLSGSIDELDATMAEIRAAIFELHEDDVPASTVRRQLSEVVRRITEGHGLRRDLRLRGGIDELPRDLVPDLVAVVRELLTNVVRHAAATRVTVTVHADEEVRVVVTDNGVGLPAVTARSGLANLADRAERHGGRLLTSAGATGTEIRWVVPRPPG